MLSRIVLKRGGKPEGESPFWISFADLMTALMTLFLVVMAVTLVSVTEGRTKEEAKKIQREKDISELMSEIEESSREFKAVKVNKSTYRIDLGDKVNFESGRADIDAAKAKFLRRYVPLLLKAQSTKIGQEWIRRIVIEGFTDQDGTYLYNLALSLNRSRSVVCVLFAPQLADEVPLSAAQKAQISDLFLVGGYSFNSIRVNKADSRRVEFKVDFWQVGEKGTAAPKPQGIEFGQC